MNYKQKQRSIEIQKIILEYFKTNHRLILKGFEQETGIAGSSAWRNLYKLEKDGKLIKIGQKQSSYWVLNFRF